MSNTSFSLGYAAPVPAMTTPAPAATTAQAATATTPAAAAAAPVTASLAPSTSTTPSSSAASGFGDSPFGASPAPSSAFGSGFAAFADSSTSFSSGFGGGGGLFGSSPNTAAAPSAFGCSPSSGFSFANPPSGGGTPFGLPMSYQAQATPSTTGFHAVYPPPTPSFAVPPGMRSHQPSTFQVPPTSLTFVTPAVPTAPVPAPQLNQQPIVKSEVLKKKKKPVSSLVMDEDEGSVVFPSRDGAEFRYRLTLTKSDKIKVWIQDKACKHQWESKELSLSEIVPTEKVIPTMELKDYFESFKSCLLVPPGSLFKDSNKYNLVTPLKKEMSDNEDIELQLTLSVVIFSKVLAPTYSFSLQSVKMSEMDILNAKIHDQEDEIEQLRTQVDALASKMEGATLGVSAPAAATASLFSSYSAAPQYIRAETMRITNPDQSLVWKGCDNTAGLFGGICQLHDSGAIRFTRDGLYSVQVVVHHTNTYAPENTGFFGRGCAERAAFFLQKNGLAVASSFGSNAIGAIQSSPMYHILSVRSGEELRVVYYGTGIAKEGSYIIIHEQWEERKLASRESPQAAAPPPAGLYEALQRESKRIVRCRAVADSLQLLVICNHKTWTLRGPLHRSRPDLILTFEGKGSGSGGVIGKKLPRALTALSSVLSHSYRLNAFPTLKTAFWKELLLSNMVNRVGLSDEPCVDDWLWMVQHESFPVFRVTLDRKGRMTDQHMDAFFIFLTTPAPHGLDAKFEQECAALAPRHKLIPITLMLGHSKPKLDCLHRIKGLLDRVFASSTRGFDIDQLDLRFQRMDAPRLEVIADILERNHTVYRIPDVRLTDAVKRKMTSGDEDEALRKLVVAAINTSATSSSPHPSSGALQTLYLDNTSLGLQHVVALCSALRYGCTIETLQLQMTLNKLNGADRQESWRWLAFGIFVPRSKHFCFTTNKRLRVDLSHNLLRPSDVEAFVSTLRDPAGELAYQGKPKPPRKSRFADTISTCVVKSGAKLHAAAKLTSKVHMELNHEIRLEVLCQQRGWACVVLAGVGIAWVNDDQIVSTEHEDTSDDAFRVELTFTDILRARVAMAAFETLVTNVGHRLSYLDVSNSVIGAGATTLGLILTHCVNLEHLVLVGSLLAPHHVDQLIDALRGDLGACLLSLDLSKNHLGNDVLAKFANVLGSNASRIPALQELRVVNPIIDPEQYNVIRDALVVNKTLRFLVLLAPSRSSLDAESYRAARAAYLSVEETTQDELLPSPLPIALKVAFLSVIDRHIQVSEGTATAARCALDSFMVSTIFQYAAENLRRRIIWCQSVHS